jgi:hypothetical protein
MSQFDHATHTTRTPTAYVQFLTYATPPLEVRSRTEAIHEPEPLIRIDPEHSAMSSWPANGRSSGRRVASVSLSLRPAAFSGQRSRRGA